LSDDVLDRDLEAALSVEPPPGFVARVRTRVAREQVASTWPSWTLVAAGSSLAVAVLILAVAIAWPGAGPDRQAARGAAAGVPAVEDRIAPATAARTSEPAGPRAASDAPAAPPPTLAPRTGSVPEVNAAVSMVSGDEPPFTEVIVSADQQRALAAVMATLRRGVMPRLPDEPEEISEEPLPAIQIEPITIEDVAIVASRQ
jgi:hypothetical protein